MTQHAGLFTEIDSGAVTRVNLGEWAVRRGLATIEQLEACLKIQRERLQAQGQAPRLGEILVERGHLTPAQVAEALAGQHQEIRVCDGCSIRMNVPRRADAEAFRCPRCGSILRPARPTEGVGVVDDAAVVVSREPVPDDVARAAADPACRFGKYVLLNEIGRGGVGAVHRAWDTLLCQVVALKRLVPNDGPETAPMREARVLSLVKEARNAIRLRHPSIVSIYDVGRVEGEYYVSMEYLDGVSLLDRLNRAREAGKPSPYYESPREILRIMAEVARAVHYAHTRPAPIIHCDLKPANILIDREGHAHVLDFGLARNLQTEPGVPGDISGTPSYMAPEQCSGESHKIDPRTDVYGFGAVLYEMLAGRPPFVGEPLEILERTMRQAPESPSEVLRDTDRRQRNAELSTKRLLRIPSDIEEICIRCLHKDRDGRPGSLEDVARVLERAAGGHASSAAHPKPAPPPDPATPAAPAAPRARPRTAWLLSAAAFLTAAAATAVFLARPDPWTSAEREVHARIAEFLPEQAVVCAEELRLKHRGTPQEDRAAMLLEEAHWAERLKERLTAALQARPAELADLRLRSGSRGRQRVLGASLDGIQAGALNGGRLIGWEDLHPLTVVALAETAMPEVTPSDRLALALVCLRAGENPSALRLLSDLRGTPLRAVADRYLARLPR
ncbi:MAG TPA: protein kinase [Planctomycetota bacterium]|nr:protein kinase [Planctomycetota bacterium]